jgi:hypothetical protein
MPFNHRLSEGRDLARQGVAIEAEIGVHELVTHENPRKLGFQGGFETPRGLAQPVILHLEPSRRLCPARRGARGFGGELTFGQQETPAGGPRARTGHTSGGGASLGSPART